MSLCLKEKDKKLEYRIKGNEIANYSQPQWYLIKIIIVIEGAKYTNLSASEPIPYI